MENLVEIIDNLNTSIWGEEGENEENFEYNFNYRYYTSFELIFFDDILLWNSNNDEREWIEELDDYEDLEEFIKKEYCKLSEKMLTFKNFIK